MIAVLQTEVDEKSRGLRRMQAVIAVLQSVEVSSVRACAVIEVLQPMGLRRMRAVIEVFQFVSSAVGVCFCPIASRILSLANTKWLTQVSSR